MPIKKISPSELDEESFFASDKYKESHPERQQRLHIIDNYDLPTISFRQAEN